MSMSVVDAIGLIEVQSLRVIQALERIATALERTAEADPLAVFNEAILYSDGEIVAQYPKPNAPIASNGQTILYALNADYQIVARKDRSEESGYSVSVEEAGAAL